MTRRQIQLPISRSWILAIVAFMMIVFGGGAGVFLAIDATVNRLNAAAGGQCYRVNVLRYLDNRSAYERWRVDKRFADLVLHPPVTRQLPNNQREARITKKVTIAFGHLLLSQAAAERFRPLTNCDKAVLHPSTYVPPHAIFFSSALTNKLYLHELHHPPPTPQQGHY